MIWNHTQRRYCIWQIWWSFFNYHLWGEALNYRGHLLSVGSWQLIIQTGVIDHPIGDTRILLHVRIYQRVPLHWYILTYSCLEAVILKFQYHNKQQARRIVFQRGGPDLPQNILTNYLYQNIFIVIKSIKEGGGQSDSLIHVVNTNLQYTCNTSTAQKKFVDW